MIGIVVEADVFFAVESSLDYECGYIEDIDGFGGIGRKGSGGEVGDLLPEVF